MRYGQSSVKLPTTTEALILAILSGPQRYGAQIRRRYEKRTGRLMPAGSLYATLHRMEAKGLLKSQRAKSAGRAGGNRRRYYALTAKGTRALRAMREWMGQMKLKK